MRLAETLVAIYVPCIISKIWGVPIHLLRLRVLAINPNIHKLCFTECLSIRLTTNLSTFSMFSSCYHFNLTFKHIT